MSDKLTPEELQRYHDMGFWNGALSSDTLLPLLAHIDAVKAERDEAAALLREVVERWPTCGDCCAWCGSLLLPTCDHHTSCIIPRALAALEHARTDA